MASHSQSGDAATANDSDDEFDPSADMLVNDFDDEHTLEEEEENEDNDNDEEIDDLQREGEMPLEELLAMYGCGPPAAAKAREKPSSSSEAEVTSSSQPSSCQPSQSDGERLEPDSEVSAGSSHDYWKLPSSSGRLLFAESDGDEDDDDEDDDTYDENEILLEEAQWKRQIQVGPEHQADVPEGLAEYGDSSPPYEEADVILWDPSQLPEQEVDQYLSSVQVGTENSAASGGGEGDGDSAQQQFDALSLLHQCGYKAEEAIKRRQLLSTRNGVPANTFSSPDAENFEIGLKVHGKDFHAIQKDQVPTRSVRELVQYYYAWKMTERFKLFLLQLDEIPLTKFRTDKRKFHSGNGVETSIEDSDLTSGPGTVTSPTSKTANACPSHSLIPLNYGQGNRATAVTSAAVCEIDFAANYAGIQTMFPNGLTKQMEVSAARLVSEGPKRVQSQENETRSTSPSTTTSVNPQAANLTSNKNDNSIDCT